jgi:hypothetical protein
LLALETKSQFINFYSPRQIKRSQKKQSHNVEAQRQSKNKQNQVKSRKKANPRQKPTTT